MDEYLQNKLIDCLSNFDFTPSDYNDWELLDASNKLISCVLQDVSYQNLSSKDLVQLKRLCEDCVKLLVNERMRYN